MSDSVVAQGLLCISASQRIVKVQYSLSVHKLVQQALLHQIAAQVAKSIPMHVTQLDGMQCMPLAQGLTLLLVLAGFSSSSGSSGSEQGGFMTAVKDKAATEVEGSDGSGSNSGSGSGSRRLWGSRVAKFLSSCSGNLGTSGQCFTCAQHVQFLLPLSLT